MKVTYAALAGVVCTLAIGAQSALAQAPASPAEDETVTLSPFEVRTCLLYTSRRG